MKGVQCHSSGKCKSKPQWDTISHLSKGLLPKRQEVINAGKDVEKGEHSHTVGGKINWSRHCGKKHGGFPKN